MSSITRERVDGTRSVGLTRHTYEEIVAAEEIARAADTALDVALTDVAAIIGLSQPSTLT